MTNHTIKLTLLVCVAAMVFSSRDMNAQKKKANVAEPAKETVEFSLPSKETDEQKAERMLWWSDARFGMFIHWGIYSQAAREAWVKYCEYMSEEEYSKYFKYFNPDLYNPKEWAKQAKAAGMKYVVLTTKHHDGFCLWDSEYTDYNSMNTPVGKDLVKEFVDAFRAEGIRIGFYYSLIDWHHPDFLYSGGQPQIVDGKSYEEMNKGRDEARYAQYMKDQVTELLTNYGKIDIIWFDFSYNEHPDWDSEGMLKLVRTLQPEIIVNDRLDLNDVWGGWDFFSPEQFMKDKCWEWQGKKVHWETCQTFSGAWGYFRDETTWKSSAQLIELLIETVSKSGNILLNVGPTARGEFDYRAKDRLNAIGEWMHFNSRAIYGCGEAPEGFNAPANSRLTYNPKTNRLYISLLDYPLSRINADFMDKVEYAQFLHDASEIKFDEKGFILPVLKPNTEIPVIEVYLR